MSLFIPRVFATINEDFMKKVFHERLNIGKVSHVDFVLKVGRDSVVYHSAYVHFEEWFDHPKNHELQARLNRHYSIKTSGATGKKAETLEDIKLAYDEPWYWIVLKNNTHKFGGNGVRREKLSLEKDIGVVDHPPAAAAPEAPEAPEVIVQTTTKAVAAPAATTKPNPWLFRPRILSSLPMPKPLENKIPPPDSQVEVIRCKTPPPVVSSSLSESVVGENQEDHHSLLSYSSSLDDEVYDLIEKGLGVCNEIRITITPLGGEEKEEEEEEENRDEKAGSFPLLKPLPLVREIKREYAEEEVRVNDDHVEDDILRLPEVLTVQDLSVVVTTTTTTTHSEESEESNNPADVAAEEEDDSDSIASYYHDMDDVLFHMPEDCFDDDDDDDFSLKEEEDDSSEDEEEVDVIVSPQVDPLLGPAAAAANHYYYPYANMYYPYSYPLSYYVHQPQYAWMMNGFYSVY